MGARLDKGPTLRGHAVDPWKKEPRGSSDADPGKRGQAGRVRRGGTLLSH